MKISSRKQKGRRLQQYITNKLRKIYKLDETINSYYEGDVRTTVMGEGGRDIKLSPKAEKIIPFDIETKNQENWNIRQWWKQTTINTGNDRVSLLIMKKNRQEPLVLLKLDDLLNICEEKEKWKRVLMEKNG